MNAMDALMYAHERCGREKEREERYRREKEREERY